MREKEFLPAVADKLGIAELNPMQQRMLQSSTEASEIVLLSPTGSGKTLAFVLPMLKWMKPSTGRVQAVVIAPSRELVQQIAEIIRRIATGFKASVLYGGHNVEDEKNTLSVTPDIIIATPGRLLDHIKRGNVDVTPVRILVLDEFDKSLELGFEEDMKKIIGRLKNVSRLILTSATDLNPLPDYLPLSKPLKLSYLSQNENLRSRLRVHRVDSDSKDKLAGLEQLLLSLSSQDGPERTIVFVNHRESAERVAEYLKSHGAKCTLYHGALDQRDREKSIAMFNNGSRPILIATDLAARGLDIEGVKSVIHYHQPLTPEAFTHRNGRTARVDAQGDVYLLIGPEEDVKPWVEFDDTRFPSASKDATLGKSRFDTLYIAEGKKEKISRGDILGFLVKDGELPADKVGKIDIYDHYALVAVAESAEKLCEKLAGKKLKGRKVRILPAEV